jgi:hypothetical protein
MQLNVFILIAVLQWLTRGSFDKFQSFILNP